MKLPKWFPTRKSWKRLTGTLIAVVGVLSHPKLLELLPADAAAIVAGVGVVIKVIGEVDAQARVESTP